MNMSRERLLRAGMAGLAAAVVSLYLVSHYHPCDGIGPLMVLPFLSAGIVLLSSLPSVTSQRMLVPAAVVATVFAVAIGLDYSGSGFVGPDGGRCEPVPGVAGFALAAFWTATLSLLGSGAAKLIVGTVSWLRLERRGGRADAGAEGTEV